ncbi:MAG: PBP1A family penicillin-binding protein [Clostridia bacterium]|nr:PBP1A family penicillin-binding protein [Clostridia bacterium]
MTPQKSKKRKRRLNIFRVAILLIIFLGVIAVGAAAGLTIGVVRAMPDWDPKDLNLAMTTFIYDKDGQLVEELHGEQNRVIVSLDQVPINLQNAVIAIEDERFRQHHGVDLKAILRAFWTNLRSGDIREGGSTITQQLAKNAFIENPTEKKYSRKIQEALMAIQLERTYTKDEILENYLNIVYLGPGIYGVEAASHYYFGKSVSELDLAEAAMLAGIIQSPGTYSPFDKEKLPAAKKRQAQVLNNMVRLGFIEAEQAEAAKAQELEFHQASKTDAVKFPYFIDTVIDEASTLLEKEGLSSSLLYQGGLRIYTTLDPRIQSEMERVYQDEKNFPPGTDERIVESAMVVIDHRSGEVRGIVGGRNYTTRRGFNYATQSERQPGSTIKPLVVYGPALEQGYSPAYVLDDIPVSYPGNPPYAPANYDHRYRGLISMREAIRWSVNIPAVKMLNIIGIDSGYEFGCRLGLPLQASDRNLSLALGGLTTGVSPLQMAAAYGAFANQGIYIEPHVVTKITDRNDRVLVEVRPNKKAVMSEQVAYIMTDMLTTVVNSGTGTNARLNRPVAGKTGTTSLPDLPEYRGKNGSKDAWFVAYTPELVAAVWMGYDPTDPKHYLRNAAGGGHPALIWKKVISFALEGQPVQNFPRPGGIIYADVDAKSGQLPSDLTPKEYIVKEIFTQEMLPKKISEAWVEAPVCTTSGQLASPACPSVTNGIFLNRPEDPSGRAEDAKLAMPKEVCPLHSGGSVPGMVSICTDPRHEGVPHLANVPGPGQSGGCPPETVRQVQLPPQTILPDRCDLPEHQLSKGTTSPGNGSAAPKAPELKARLQVDPQLNAPRITLEWSSAGKGNILYSVERRTPDSPYKSIAIIKETTYNDTNINPGSAYRYRIVALNQDDNSNLPSNEVTVTIPER